MKDLSFAQAMKRLEEIVEKLETKDVDLEEGLNLLTEGFKLHKYCSSKLKSSQKTINKLAAESEVN